LSVYIDEGDVRWDESLEDFSIKYGIEIVECPFVVFGQESARVGAEARDSLYALAYASEALRPDANHVIVRRNHNRRISVTYPVYEDKFWIDDIPLGFFADRFGRFVEAMIPRMFWQHEAMERNWHLESDFLVDETRYSLYGTNISVCDGQQFKPIVVLQLFVWGEEIKEIDTYWSCVVPHYLTVAVPKFNAEQAQKRLAYVMPYSSDRLGEDQVFGVCNQVNFLMGAVFSAEDCDSSILSVLANYVQTNYADDDVLFISEDCISMEEALCGGGSSRRRRVEF
jgi:hypothetical protein